MYGNAYQVAASKQSAANAKAYEHNGIPRGSVVGPSPITGKYRRHLGNNQWEEVTWNAATRTFAPVAPPAQPQQQAAQQPPPPAPAPQAPAAQQPPPPAPAPQPAAAQQGAAAPVPASTYAGGKPTAAQTPTSYVGGAGTGYTAPRGRGRSKRFY